MVEYADVIVELCSHMCVNVSTGDQAIFTAWTNYGYTEEGERVDYFVVVKLVDIGKYGVNVWITTTTRDGAYQRMQADDLSPYSAHTTLRSWNDVSHLVRHLSWLGLNVHNTEIADAINK